jgi:DNA invertase Pin-like site-specific DNA recombinase
MKSERIRLKALGYVSTTGAAGGFGEAERTEQVAALERFCARRGWELAALVYDVEQARRRSPTRPALAYAMERLRREEIACLVVTELGRLCRSVAELRTVLAAVEQAGARLVSLQPRIDTGTESGLAAAQILRAVSDWERTRAAERSRIGLAAARARGAIQPAIQPELKRQITRMRAAGMTLQAIVDELNAAGVPTVRGGAEWRVSSVQAAIGYKRPGRN